MARTWLTVEVELVAGGGREPWPRPGRVLVARPGHSFRQLAEAIETAFGRWDRAHLRQFTLASGDRLVPFEWYDDPEPDDLDDAGERLSRLELGETFAYEFDLGEGWQHRCTVGDTKVDVVEVAGIRPELPIPIFGWGELPDQYGRRWADDDGSGEVPPAPDPPLSDLPPLLHRWGSSRRPGVHHEATAATEPLATIGTWRPLAWTREAMTALHAAVQRDDLTAFLAVLVGRDPLDVAHTAAPELLRGAASGERTVQAYAEELADDLDDRWWDGDPELAAELRAAVGGTEPTPLRDVAVDLDELTMVLGQGGPDAAHARLHLPTGRIWSADLSISGEDEPDDWDDPDRWLTVWPEGSSAGWDDMSDFITTVEDGELSERLDDAIRGKGAFGRFGDRLRPHEAEWSRWQRFQRERQLGRARAWLAREGYRPTA